MWTCCVCGVRVRVEITKDHVTLDIDVGRVPIDIRALCTPTGRLLVEVVAGVVARGCAHDGPSVFGRWWVCELWSGRV